nr:hypothetical protein B0A51_04976 [Rachicladosporium sp. CCFEE 5018]
MSRVLEPGKLTAICCATEIKLNKLFEHLERTDLVFVDSITKSYLEDDQRGHVSTSSASSDFVDKTPEECSQMLFDMCKAGSNINYEKFVIYDARSRDDHTVLVAGKEYLVDDTTDQDQAKPAGTYKLHEPDIADFIPRHRRRELLLDNGERVLCGDSDADRNWSKEIFFIDGKPARFVKELLGDEKSPGLRPDADSEGYLDADNGPDDQRAPVESVRMNIDLVRERLLFYLDDGEMTEDVVRAKRRGDQVLTRENAEDELTPDEFHRAHGSSHCDEQWPTKTYKVADIDSLKSYRPVSHRYFLHDDGHVSMMFEQVDDERIDFVGMIVPAGRKSTRIVRELSGDEVIADLGPNVDTSAVESAFAMLRAGKALREASTDM